MFIHSLVWERTVLSLLEKLKALAPNVRIEIAARVGNYIDLAKTLSDDASLALRHGCGRGAAEGTRQRSKIPS